MADDTVADLAQLYLGNILYAIELAALSLQEQGRTDDAGFYRAIARKLAEARGREVAAPPSGHEQAGAARVERPNR